MNERTVTLKNVQVTETELREALASLEDRRVRVKVSEDEDALDKAMTELCPELCSSFGVRISGNLTGLGFYLDTDNFDWAIETDDEGAAVLTARYKESR